MLVSAVSRYHVGQRAQGHNVVEGQLLAVICSVVGRTPITGMWKTQNTFEPSELTQSETRLLSPLMTEEIVITVVTPMTMPRNGQARPQLVGPQRIQRHFDGFAGLSLRHEKLRRSGIRG